MPFIPLSHGMRVVVEYSLHGQLVVNVYHVTSVDPVVTANLEALAGLFIAWWNDGFATEMKGWFTSDLVLQRVVVTDVSVDDGEQFVLAPSTPIPGAGSDDSEPGNVALVVSMRSTFTGRSRRGRSYYAGLSEVYVVNSLVSGTVVTGIINSVIELVNELQENDYRLVIASYVSNGAPRVTALATPVTVVSANTVVDSQRRRLPGRGV